MRKSLVKAITEVLDRSCNIAKSNPNHAPAGSPKGGQFTSGKSSVPSKEKIREKSVRSIESYSDTVHPFDTIEELSNWVKGNIADEFSIDTSPVLYPQPTEFEVLRDANDALLPLRHLISSGVVFPKLSELTMSHNSSIDDGYGTRVCGVFIPNKNSIHMALLPSKERRSSAPSGQNEMLDRNRRHFQEGYGGVVNADNLYSYKSAGILIHELGHAWNYWNSDLLEKSFGKGYNLSKKYNVSDENKQTSYSDYEDYNTVPWDDISTSYSGANKAENFAENFSLYLLGLTKQIPNKQRKFFDKHLSFHELQKGDISVNDIEKAVDNSCLRQRKFKKQKRLKMVIHRIDDQIQRVRGQEEVVKSNPNHYPKGSGKGGQFAPRRTNPSLAPEGATTIKKPVRPVAKSKKGLAGSDEAHALIEALAKRGTTDPKSISDQLKKAGHKTATGRAISTSTIKAVLNRIDKAISQNKITSTTSSHSKAHVEKLVGLFRSMGHDDKTIQGKLKEKGVKTESGRNVSISTIRAVIKRVDKSLQDTKNKIVAAKPEPIKEQPKPSTEVIKGMDAGKRSVVYNYAKPFQTIGEAQIWVKRNLADDMHFPEPLPHDNAVLLHNINSALSHVRMLAENGVALPRLDTLRIHQTEAIDMSQYPGGKGTAYGFFNPRGNSVHLAIPPYIKEDPLGNAVQQINMNQEGLVARAKQILDAKQHKSQGLKPTSVDHMRSDKELTSLLQDNMARQRELYDVGTKMQETGQIDRGSLQRYPNRSLVHEGCRATYTFDSRLAGTLMHELGHAYHYNKSEDAAQDLGADYNYKKNLKEWYNGGKDRTQQVNPQFVTSPYSGVNKNENFAEAFALYMNGQVQGLHPKYVEFFDKQFPQLNFGKKLMRKTELIKAEIIEVIKKYNPNHYPKGSAKGGEFAPKSGVSALKEKDRKLVETTLRVYGNDFKGASKSLQSKKIYVSEQDLKDYSFSSKETPKTVDVSKPPVRPELPKPAVATPKSVVPKPLVKAKLATQQAQAKPQPKKEVPVKESTPAQKEKKAERILEKKPDAAIMKGVRVGKRSLIYEYDPPFKTLEEAKTWATENLAGSVVFPKINGSKRQQQFLNSINDTLAHARLLKKNGFDLPKVRTISFGVNSIGESFGLEANGTYDPSRDAIAMRIDLSEDFGGKAHVQDRFARSSRALHFQYEKSKILSKNAKNALTEQQQGYSDYIRSKNPGDTVRYAPHGIISEDSWPNLPHASTSYDSRLSGSLIHELGHAWHAKNSKECRRALGRAFDFNEVSSFYRENGHYPSYTKDESARIQQTSGYSKGNVCETFAEAFSLYMNGQHQSIHPTMNEFLAEHFPQIGTTGKRESASERVSRSKEKVAEQTRERKLAEAFDEISAAFSKKDILHLMKKTELIKAEILEVIKKHNPNHAPAGSPKGGEFVSSKEGSLATSVANFKTIDQIKEFFDRQFPMLNFGGTGETKKLDSIKSDILKSIRKAVKK